MVTEPDRLFPNPVFKGGEGGLEDTTDLSLLGNSAAFRDRLWEIYQESIAKGG